MARREPDHPGDLLNFQRRQTERQRALASPPGLGRSVRNPSDRSISDRYRLHDPWL